MSYEYPVRDAPISSGYGPRIDPITGAVGSYHYGVDWAVPTGTQVYAPNAGTVMIAGPAGTYGNAVYIRDYENGYVHELGHLSIVQIYAGQDVSKGQPVALSGSTGQSTGPHLHWTVKHLGVPFDPLTLDFTSDVPVPNLPDIPEIIRPIAKDDDMSVLIHVAENPEGSRYALVDADLKAVFYVSEKAGNDSVELGTKVPVDLSNKDWTAYFNSLKTEKFVQVGF